MNTRNIVLLLMLFLSDLAVAQDQNCSCEASLQQIIQKIETEYPGFDVKTTDKALYTQLKEQVSKAAHTSDKDSCLEVLRTYTGFFKDRHIWVLPAEDPKPQQALAPKAQLFSIDTAKFRKSVQHSNGLEGIWKDEAYEIGLKKVNDSTYTGFILKADPQYWKPREIKLRLHINGHYEYYMQDHSVQKGTYTLHDNCILSLKEINSTFVRCIPGPPLSPEALSARISELNGIYCKKISPRTTLLKLQYFSYAFIGAIEQTIAKNQNLLENTEFLIIDLRDNGGGTDIAYRDILPYLYTNPIRYIGAELLASPTLISTTEKYLQEIKRDPVKNQADIADLENKLTLLRANPGKYVRHHKEKVRIDTLQPALKGPKQVILLVNKHTGSAAENLVLAARQSKKVKVIGTPSSGVLDYANAMFFEYGCRNYKLLLPTYRSLRLPDYPIDNIGAQPDIYMDDSVEDWIKFSLEYLENR